MTYYIKPYRCVTIVIVYSDPSLFDKFSIGPLWSYCEKKNCEKKGEANRVIKIKVQRGKTA